MDCACTFTQTVTVNFIAVLTKFRVGMKNVDTINSQPFRSLLLFFFWHVLLKYASQSQLQRSYNWKIPAQFKCKSKEISVTNAFQTRNLNEFCCDVILIVT